MADEGMNRDFLFNSLTATVIRESNNSHMGQFMKTIFIAEPVVTAGNSNRLIAVEILSRFYSVNGKQLPTVKTLNMFTAEMKIDLLELQIRKIISKASFFSKHNILCSLNVDYDTCQYIYRNKNIQDIIKSYDFIVLEISETYPVIKADDAIIPFLINLSEHIWLDNLGSGNSTIHTLIRNKYQAVKLDKSFFQKHSMKPHFSALIDNIKDFALWLLPRVLKIRIIFMLLQELVYGVFRDIIFHQYSLRIFIR
ncbi:EAL domain-containing protein [Escherichia coli]|nr:EAL domain-containing protein [Escherichia coli]MCT6077843.1 EAL domain-containing protein [Escherichia coli]